MQGLAIQVAAGYPPCPDRLGHGGRGSAPKFESARLVADPSERGHRAMRSRRSEGAGDRLRLAQQGQSSRGTECPQLVWAGRRRGVRRDSGRSCSAKGAEFLRALEGQNRRPLGDRSLSKQGTMDAEVVAKIRHDQSPRTCRQQFQKLAA